jgi:outer membrane protein assembly factor BamB
MKKQTILSIVFLFILIAGASFYVISYHLQKTTLITVEQLELYETVDTVAMVDKITITEEVTAKFGAPKSFKGENNLLKFNSDTTLKFPTVFRSGHVKKEKLKKYLTITDYGYIIQLPSPTTITTPIYSNENLMVSGGFGSKSYYSFNFEDGSLNWAVNLGDDGPSSAVCDDDQVIFNTESCTIFALDIETGEMNWSLWLGDPLMSTPALSNGYVYTSYPYANILSDSKVLKKYDSVRPTHPFACFDASDGSIEWQVWLDGDVMITPTVHGDDIYLTTNPGSVYRINKNTGKLLAASSMMATSTPTIQGDKLFLTRRSTSKDTVMESIAVLNRYNFKIIHELGAQKAPYLDARIQATTQLKSKALVLDAANGFAGGAPMTSGWKKASLNIGQSNVSSLQAFQASTVMISGDFAYNLMGDVIYCSNYSSGEKIWQHRISGDLKKTGGTLATTPILSGNHLITVSLTGEIFILEKESGKVAWQKDINETVRCAPIIVDGHLVVPTTTGKLIKIDTGLDDLKDCHMLFGNSEHSVNSET